MRVGLLGGAFNPPHIGHLACAQEAAVALGLDSVVLMPMGRAPHREIDPEPGAELRLELTELAARGDERLSVSRLEVDREGPSYTVETVEAMREQQPDDELLVILGGDQAAALPSWHEPERLLELASVAVVPRTRYSRDLVALNAARVKGADRIRFFDMPRIDVSSTLVRNRIEAGKPIRYLVPDAVAEAIEARGLYSASPVGAG